MSSEKEAIVKISEIFTQLGIPSVIVGASARDIICEQYNLPVAIRKTSDVDFGIFVKDWDELKKVEEHLKSISEIKKAGEKENKVRYHYNGTPFDIVPFGGVAKDNKVSWPPYYDTIMTVLGYEEALAHSIIVKIQNSEVKVVALEILIALKMIAWDENFSREKDIVDSWYLIKNYSKIDPSSYEYVLENYLELLETFDLEPEYAEPLHIGIKLKKLLKDETLELMKRILADEAKMEKVARIAVRELLGEQDKEEEKIKNIFKAIYEGLI